MEYTEFEDRETASRAAADFLAQHLERRLAEQRRASLIVTGGSSPGRCYEHLSGKALDWDRVDLILSDERWVAADHEDSNEKLLRDKLAINGASAASILKMYDDDATIEARVETLNQELKLRPVPFSAALLGMGEDGHFASLFPDAEKLAEGLDSDNPDFCIAVSTSASPYPRLSLTLSAISRSDAVLLLIFGDAKKAVIEDARAGKGDYPVADLLRQKRAPVHVYWAK